jgi:hypothetical protein
MVMSKSSSRRKAKRAMYKRLKKENRLIKPVTKNTRLLPNTIPQFNLYAPKIKRALSRVIEFEVRKPGEFSKWLEDLHIEHYRARFQEKLDEQKERDKDSQKQTVTEAEIGRFD